MEQEKFVYTEDPRCEVTYRRSDNVVDLMRTYVPKESRGKGIAQILANAALLWAQANNLKVIPSCSFMEKYIEQHEEFQNLRSDLGKKS